MKCTKQFDNIFIAVFLKIPTEHCLHNSSGEIVKISKEGVKSMCVVPRPEEAASAFCIFEYVYFARPDSIMEGKYWFTLVYPRLP